jgi:hypothetical protein
MPRKRISYWLLAGIVIAVILLCTQPEAQEPPATLRDYPEIKQSGILRAVTEYNAIKLEIPKAGKKVTVDFRALDAEGKVFKASKDKMARTIGYRYGLVGVTADTDECIYSPMSEAKSGKVSQELPSPPDRAP